MREEQQKVPIPGLEPGPNSSQQESYRDLNTRILPVNHEPSRGRSEADTKFQSSKPSLQSRSQTHRAGISWNRDDTNRPLLCALFFLAPPFLPPTLSRTSFVCACRRCSPVHTSFISRRTRQTKTNRSRRLICRHAHRHRLISQ
jgi:hypothetical protein